MLSAIWLMALTALSAMVDCTCPEGYEPLNKTMRMLTISQPITWNKVESLCVKQFGIGFGMLGRDFLLLFDADKALCPGHEVPLRLKNDGRGRVVWPKSSRRLPKEGVSDTYLARMSVDPGAFSRHLEEPVSGVLGVGKISTETAESEISTKKAISVGSLNISTGLWHLVDVDTKFTCVICQRALLGSFFLSHLTPKRQRPLANAFTFRLVETGNNSINVDEAILMAEKHLNEMVDQLDRRMQAKIVKVDGDPGGLEGTLLRLTSSGSIRPDDVDRALNDTYLVRYWQDMDFCPATSFEGKYLKKTLIGVAANVQLQDFQVATRWCLWKSFPDGDQDAAWDDDILLWVDRQEICRAHGFSDLVNRLQDFAKRPDPRDLDLKSLVKITTDADELDIPIKRWKSTMTNLTIPIVDILSLLVGNAKNESTASACYGIACVFLTADNYSTDGPNTLLVSRKQERPKFLNINESSATNQTKLASLQLSPALAWAGSVAVHTWQLLNFIERRCVDITLLSCVVLPRSFEESEPDRSRPVVTVRLNNNGADCRDRYEYVTNLGESEESDWPCPWVRSEGSVDVYLCNKWKRGPRNDTIATFLINTDNVFSYLLHRVLLGYATIPVDEYAILNVAIVTNNALSRYKYNVRSADDFNPWESILSGVVLTEPVFTVSLEHVKVLLSNLAVNDPVIGLSFTRQVGVGIVQNITASTRHKVTAESRVDLVLGAGLQEHGHQLALLAITNVARLPFKGFLEAYIKRMLMVVHLVVTSRSDTEAGTENEYFDIHLLEEKSAAENKIISDAVNFNGDKSDVLQVNINKSQPVVVTTKLRFQVATWSEVDRDWLVSSCSKLRSTRASKPVVRCDRLTFADKQFRGRYLVFEPVGFAEAFRTPFLVVLIAAGFLSGVSLASIVSTVAALPAWRKDLGHKILLHMALALWFNLALGFTSSFVSIDTADVACIAVGALRHFSFLAMFAWMLLMSSLQLRRLLTVVGARDTPNLLLKVSFFGWGVPTLTVVFLLSFNTDMYQSDAADRGFCYPEGSAFTWSVQAPAATVLALNGVIFLVILARLYGFLGWGQTQDLKRHINEFTFQIRRLRAVFYTFCLFGITWVFHLLAEYGVFQEKYLYEYLFLMTASVHVFMLSFIFVLCDQEARAEWAQVLAPLRNRWATLTVPLRDRWATFIVPLRDRWATLTVPLRNRWATLIASLRDKQHD